MILAAVALPHPAHVTPEGLWKSSAYDAALSAIRAAGYRHFELTGTRRLTAAVAAAIRERAAGMGLTPVALHAPALHGPRELERQLAIAAAAHALGAPVLVFHVSSYRYDHPEWEVRHETWERDRARIRALAEFLGERAMKLALENGSRSLHYGYLQDQVEMAREVGLENVGVALDTGHANMGFEPAHKVATEVASLALHTHLHDNNGRRDDHLPPGRGGILWPRVVSPLFAAKYAGAWCLELKARPERDLEEKLIEAKHFLERLFSLA